MHWMTVDKEAEIKVVPARMRIFSMTSKTLQLGIRQLLVRLAHLSEVIRVI